MTSSPGRFARLEGNRGRPLAAVGLLLGVVALTGCGSQLSHQQFVAAADGTTVVSTSGGASGDGASTSGNTGSSVSQATAAPGGGTPVGSAAGTTDGTDSGTTSAGKQPVSGATAASGGTTTGSGNATSNVSTGTVKSGGAPRGSATGKKASGSTQAAKGAKTTGTTGSSTTVATQTGPIIIGSVGDYSGVAGDAESQGPVGLQVWAQQLNASGGINGRPVKVIVEDDGSDGSKAQSEVQDLVENQHVVAFAANIAQYTIPQQRVYLEAHHIPVIGGDCGLPDWNESPVLFTECASVDTTFFMGMKIGAMFGKSKQLGLLYCAEAAVCAAANAADSNSGEGYAKANGLNIAYSDEFSLTQPDFTQQCLGMKEAGVGIVTVIGDPNVQTRVAASCARQGYSPQFLAGSALVSPALATTTGFSDMIAEMSTLPFAGLDTPAEQKFENAFKTYDPGDAPGPGGSLGWTSGLILEQALRQAAAQPGGVISPATIITAMGTIKNDTFGGASVPLSYTSGQPSADFRCEFLMEVKNNTWVTPMGDTPICR